MKTITMVQFRRRAAEILRKVARGQAFLVTYRGKPVARLEPVAPEIPDDDPIYRLAELAGHDAEPLTNDEIDRIVYGL